MLQAMICAPGYHEGTGRQSGMSLPGSLRGWLEGLLILVQEWWKVAGWQEEAE